MFKKSRSMSLMEGKSPKVIVYFVMALFLGVPVQLLAAAPPPGVVETAVQTSAQDPAQDAQRLEELIHEDVNTSLEVPPVYNRPVGIDAGKRLHVTKFVIEGVKERPEYGITQEILDALVEKLRINLQRLDVMNKYGLTKEDMEVTGEELKEALYSDDQLRLQRYEQLLERLRKDKKYREEMSIGQLQDVANRVTDFYRKKGFVVAQAYIPEQDVEDGVVKINIQEGILGNVLVEGNKDYSTDIIRQRFDDLAYKVVDKQSLENALLSLSDYPGLVAYGVLQAGTNPGETHLVIKVQEEEARSYSVRADNYGSELTGENRLTLSYTENNLFGNADDLTVNVMQAFSPTNTVFGGIKYQSPVAGSNFMAGFGVSTNAFDIGGEQAAAGVSGTVESANVFGSYQFIRSRDSNLFGKLDFVNKTAETSSNVFQISDETITSLSLEFGFDDLDIKYKGINQGKVKFTQGFKGLLGSIDENTTATLVSRTGGSGEVATSDFSKLEWSVARLQLINKYQNVLLRFNGQVSDDLLVPIERYGMGGPNNVRAFTVSEYLMDSAVFVSADWNFNAPGFYDAHAFDSWKWGEILQFSVFADYSTGKLNDPRTTDINNGIDEIDLTGYGVAAQILLPGKLQIRLDIGIPAKDPLHKDEILYYFTMSYTG